MFKRIYSLYGRLPYVKYAQRLSQILLYIRNKWNLQGVCAVIYASSILIRTWKIGCKPEKYWNFEFLLCRMKIFLLFVSCSHFKNVTYSCWTNGILTVHKNLVLSPEVNMTLAEGFAGQPDSCISFSFEVANMRLQYLHFKSSSLLLFVSLSGGFAVFSILTWFCCRFFRTIFNKIDILVGVNHGNGVSTTIFTKPIIISRFN